MSRARPLRPSLIWLAIRYLPFILLALAFALITILLLTSCAAPPRPVTNHFPLILAPPLARSGAGLQPTTFNLQPFPPRTSTLDWFQPGTCLGWTVEVSNDLKTWTVLETVWCNYVFHDRAVTTTVTTAGNPVFFRVGSFNGAP